MRSNVAIIGAGAWGLALADLLARKGERVTVWDRDSAVLDKLGAEGTRGTPKGLMMHDQVLYCADMLEAAEGAAAIICAVPSHAVRAICQRLVFLPQAPSSEDSRTGIPACPDNRNNAPNTGPDKTNALSAANCTTPSRIFISVSKGIEQDSLLLPSQIFKAELGHRTDFEFGVLAGPSHAEEVIHQVPTVVVCCAARDETSRGIQKLFNGPRFRVYRQTDCLGVELGGALKNVIAIAAGACDGLGFGDNTKAALITRGVAEIGRAAAALGAQASTVTGLSGMGDLIVTAMSQHSRNRLFGELLAKGNAPETALEKIGAAVEGYRTSKSARELSQKLNIEMPIIEAVHAVIYENQNIQTALQNLLERDAGAETA